nr:MAG TPA: hypothetical protein [Caudoviricetes sp.]
MIIPLVSRRKYGIYVIMNCSISLLRFTAGFLVLWRI